MKLTDVEVFGEPPKKYYKWFRSENIKRPWWDRPKKKSLLVIIKDFLNDFSLDKHKRMIKKSKRNRKY